MSLPEPMPEGWIPDVVLVTATAKAPNGTPLQLSFKMPLTEAGNIDADKAASLFADLRFAMWQSRELHRLGKV